MSGESVLAVRTPDRVASDLKRTYREHHRIMRVFANRAAPDYHRLKELMVNADELSYDDFRVMKPLLLSVVSVIDQAVRYVDGCLECEDCCECAAMLDWVAAAESDCRSI